MQAFQKLYTTSINSMGIASVTRDFLIKRGFRVRHVGFSHSLVPRLGFFAGWWKSEGPGISCMRMRLIRHEIIRKISCMMNDVIIKMYVARAHSISAA